LSIKPRLLFPGAAISAHSAHALQSVSTQSNLSEES